MFKMLAIFQIRLYIYKSKQNISSGWSRALRRRCRTLIYKLYSLYLKCMIEFWGLYTCSFMHFECLLFSTFHSLLYSVGVALCILNILLYIGAQVQHFCKKLQNISLFVFFIQNFKCKSENEKSIKHLLIMFVFGRQYNSFALCFASTLCAQSQFNDTLGDTPLFSHLLT